MDQRDPLGTLRVEAVHGHVGALGRRPQTEPGSSESQAVPPSLHNIVNEKTDSRPLIDCMK